jgi:hypothetical protein
MGFPSVEHSYGGEILRKGIHLTSLLISMSATAPAGV